MVLYADSSALVKLVMSEPESDALARFVGPDQKLTSSVVASVEVRRAAARADSSLVLEADILIGELELVPLDPALGASAASIPPAALRTLDAIHVASALLLGDALEALITYDRRMAEAAEALGIRVLSPR